MSREWTGEIRMTEGEERGIIINQAATWPEREFAFGL
jgi:hypothetical protein